MSDERTALSSRRARLERQAVALFGVAAVSMSVICGAIIVSKWFAGVMDDGFERFFWLGAVLAFAMVAVFAAASFPGGRDDERVIRRTTALIRIGLVLFVLSPALCIGSLVADFYL